MHLPALGILLVGAVLMLPMAVGIQVSGYDHLPAAFAFLTPPSPARG